MFVGKGFRRSVTTWCYASLSACLVSCSTPQEMAYEAASATFADQKKQGTVDPGFLQAIDTCRAQSGILNRMAITMRPYPGNLIHVRQVALQRGILRDHGSTGSIYPTGEEDCDVDSVRSAYTAYLMRRLTDGDFQNKSLAADKLSKIFRADDTSVKCLRAAKDLSAYDRCIFDFWLADAGAKVIHSRSFLHFWLDQLKSFCVSGNCENGIGTMRLPATASWKDNLGWASQNTYCWNGNNEKAQSAFVYQGSFRNMIPHGAGTITCEGISSMPGRCTGIFARACTRASYSGTFNNGTYIRGTLKYLEGGRFEGLVSQAGGYLGEGTLYDPDGAVIDTWSCFSRYDDGSCLGESSADRRAGEQYRARIAREEAATRSRERRQKDEWMTQVVTGFLMYSMQQQLAEQQKEAARYNSAQSGTNQSSVEFTGSQTSRMQVNQPTCAQILSSPAKGDCSTVRADCYAPCMAAAKAACMDRVNRAGLNDTDRTSAVSICGP